MATKTKKIKAKEYNYIADNREIPNNLRGRRLYLVKARDLLEVFTYNDIKKIIRRHISHRIFNGENEMLISDQEIKELTELWRQKK